MIAVLDRIDVDVNLNWLVLWMLKDDLQHQKYRLNKRENRKSKIIEIG